MLDPTTIRSTKSEIEAFKKSTIWMDMVHEIDSICDLAQAEYDIVGERVPLDDGGESVPTTAEVLIHLGDIKGRRKASQYFLSLPEILLNILEMKKMEKDNDSERDSAD